jgi:hypothetical protein
MSYVYLPDTARYACAALLFSDGPLLFPCIVQRSLRASMRFTPGELRAALVGLKRADLATQSPSTLDWCMTESGRSYWLKDHQRCTAIPHTPPPAPLVASERQLKPIEQDPSLRTRSIVRLASPADRLPMVYRDGALDCRDLPRVQLGWRIWPDGRRERADGDPS